jgi:ketosteroid isomerase-like protein
MSDNSGALDADRRFFAALTGADVAFLSELLADDFILVDVMGGSEVPKSALIAMVGSGQLKFDSIAPSETHERRYGSTVVIIGRTEMRIRFEQTAIATSSRYTHIYVEDHGAWRMVSAQGTQIAAASDANPG